ncbi:hypothetical protein SAMN05443572_103141 [Myxococcus fulvus]|uniref:Lipoprotein n=1 Tax=Myxococcus fulvus TaxID=33 RepID=A0ABY1C7E0_MYXFU|nr:hypothetical protein [Myxococcus fulvus]SET76953.1 hypothetical protein SAMN05443572_103141 [Myxococcus fulvus]
MRRWSLALILSLTSPVLALAQETPEPAATPPPPQEPAAQAPAASPPVKAEPPPAPVPTPAEAPAAAPEKPAAAPQKPAAEAKPPPPKRAEPVAPAPAQKPTAAPPTAATPPPAVPSNLQAGLDTVPAPPTSAEEIKRQDIQTSARVLFQFLLTGDVRSTANELFYPFQLEDKRYATPEELVAAWVKQLRVKRTDLISLYDVEVLTLEAMEKKYGKAPARLGLDLRNAKDIWVAVGNLSGRAAVLVYRPYGEEHRAFAYTD